MCKHSTCSHYCHDSIYLYTLLAWCWEPRGLASHRVASQASSKSSRRLKGDKQHYPVMWFDVSFPKKICRDAWRGTPLQCQVLKYRTLLWCLWAFFAVTKNALPQRDAHTLSLRLHESMTQFSMDFSLLKHVKSTVYLLFGNPRSA